MPQRQKKIVQSSAELLLEYAAGDRDFEAAQLSAVDLQFAQLAKVNLSKATLFKIGRAHV